MEQPYAVSDRLQLDAVLDTVRRTLGNSILGAYLYGSAIEGGLKPGSDIDVMVVVDRRTTLEQQRALVDGLRPVSSRAERPSEWRPVELTVVVLPDVVPWRYPPRTDFQSGEWLRAEFDSGAQRPWTELNGDLAVLLTMVRESSEALIGPPASELLPAVPRRDVSQAMHDAIDSLVADVESDTTNVLLTLARIWATLATGRFLSKEAAAEWASDRLEADHATVLTRARDIYLGTAPQSDWSDRAAPGQTAAVLVELTRRA